MGFKFLNVKVSTTFNSSSIVCVASREGKDWIICLCKNMHWFKFSRVSSSEVLLVCDQRHWGVWWIAQQKSLDLSASCLGDAQICKELLISWCGYLSQVLQGPTLKLCFKGSFAAPPSSPPHPISSSLINPPRLIGFGVGNFRSVLKGTLLVHGKLLSSAGLNVDFVKVTLYEGLFAIWRLAEIDANISAERWIYIHPTFVICWVECRLVYNWRFCS